MRVPMKAIPYGRQDINEEDIAAVEAVLRSEWLTQGPAVERFENATGTYCGASYGVAVNSATSGLHLACRAVGLGPGSLLWTVPNTFVASPNSALLSGASVDFVDIDPASYNMSVPALAAKLEWAARAGKLPKAVMPVHFAGRSCEMREIAELAKQYDFKIIEDASHAIGGEYLGEKIGSCRWSDIAVFSFHPVKIITTGEGGMVVTNDLALRDKTMSLRSHGITRDPLRMTSSPDGSWYYQQTELGFNFRMTELQAALGTSQLRRIDSFVVRRRQLAARYDEAFAQLPIGIPQHAPNSISAWHLYVIQVDETHAGKSRKEVFENLRAAGIRVNVHYIPVHTQPYYRQFGFSPGDFPAAEQYYARAISLPMYAALTDEEQEYIISAMLENFGGNP